MGKKQIKTVGEEKKVEKKKKTEAENDKEEKTDKTTTKKQVKVRGKKYQTAKKKVNQEKGYSLKEAIALVKESSFSQFTGTLEAHLVIKEHPFNKDVDLPHSSGKERRVVIADEKIVKEIQDGKINFDVLLASPKIMPKLVPLARILGPKGLMPNPKNGTLVDSPKKIIGQFAGNKIKVKTEKKEPVIHLALGKLNQPDKELIANIEAVVKALGANNLQRMVLKATMGPAIKVALN